MAQQTSRAENWTRTTTRNVTDVIEIALSGIVREWTHETTDDTIEIVVYNENARFYTTKYNGEPVTGHATLREAEECAVDTMRSNEDGL